MAKLQESEPKQVSNTDSTPLLETPSATPAVADPSAPCTVCGRTGPHPAIPPPPTRERFTGHVGESKDLPLSTKVVFRPVFVECYVFALGMLLLLPAIILFKNL